MFKRLLKYQWFRAYINKLAFNNQKHPHEPNELEEAFVDSNGLKYFKYRDDMETPLVRLQKVQDFLFQLERKLSDKELSKLTEAMKFQMDRALMNSSHIDKMVGYLAKTRAIIDDIALREEYILHPELMFDIVATLYIREDENPAEWSQQLHNEKVDQFKKDSAEGLYDFFYNAGLNRYLPGLTSLKDDFQQLFNYQKDKIQARNQAITKTLSK